MQNKTATAVIGAVVSIAFAGQLAAEGNRYNKDRFYQAEISAAQTYLWLQNVKGYRQGQENKRKPVLIDVRSLEEYAAGHPEDAYNVPFPKVHVDGASDQDPAVLYWEVYDIVKGRMDTPIMLLCRTGSRSVAAGNILADPDSDPATSGLEEFTNVFNIWEGFVGNLKYAYSGGTILLVDGKPVPLDLDNDGDVSHTDDYADVYEEVKDANSDKDGWRNFQGPPLDDQDSPTAGLYARSTYLR